MVRNHKELRKTNNLFTSADVRFLVESFAGTFVCHVGRSQFEILGLFFLLSSKVTPSGQEREVVLMGWNVIGKPMKKKLTSLGSAYRFYFYQVCSPVSQGQHKNVSLDKKFERDYEAYTLTHNKIVSYWENQG